MNETLFGQRVWPGNFTGAGPVTREAARKRSRELAVKAGRSTWDVRQADYEQAKREVTGESNADRQDAVLDAIPGSGRDQSVPGRAELIRPESATAATPRADFRVSDSDWVQKPADGSPRVL